MARKGYKIARFFLWQTTGKPRRTQARGRQK
jgi:hypothetical protein